MPEEEAQPSEEGGGGLMSGSRGWIIVISIVVLEAVFFIVLMKYRTSNEPADTSGGEGIVSAKGDEFLKEKITLDNLTYSIPMPSGPPMTLAMNLVIVLGKTQEEENANVTIAPEDWAVFKSTVERMEPLIRDWLYRTINKMSSSELQTERGMEDVRNYVRERINRELSKLKLKLSDEKLSHNRVTRVLITNYYFN